VFEKIHRETLRDRFRVDPLGFWSILDQINTVLLEKDWRNNKDDSASINFLLKQFVPSFAKLSRQLLPLLPQVCVVYPIAFLYLFFCFISHLLFF
jgi:hypothetical protein